MNRQPKAVRSRVVRARLVTLLGVVMAVALLVPSTALARSPSGSRVDAPWSADAVELARTAPEAVLAGTTNQKCTGWLSTYVPPPTIRVLRTVGVTRNTVEVVPFKDYVTAVMPGEWPAYYPIDAMKAGAMQVKNYGWYFTIVYRGGKLPNGTCYDVKDNTADQTYQPQKRTIYQIHRKAVAATWGYSLRRFDPLKNRSKLFLAEYRTGTSKVCGADADGKRLYQRSILRCARVNLMTWEQILRVYLHKYVEIVEPGFHDIVGEESGDAAALYKLDTGERTPRLFAPVVPNGLQAAEVGPSLAGEDFRGARAVDIDHDGRDDLLSLYAPDAGGWWRLSVALSDGSGYSEPATWAESTTDGLPQDLQMVVADYDADGRRDVGFIVPGPDAGTAKLTFIRNAHWGSVPAIDWWTGALDLATSRVWAADPTGDGRADLIVAHDLGEGGIEYLVGASLPRGGGLQPALAPWYTGTDLRWDSVKHLVGDIDRDHRDDLWLMTPGANGVAISALKATRTGAFTLVPRWSSAPSDALTFDGTRMGGGDLNYDGLADLVLYSDIAPIGTRLMALTGRYQGMTQGTVLDDPDLDFNRVAPY